MNDTVIKNFAVWARKQLIEDVKQQMARWEIDESGTTPASTDVLNGNVLTTQQREQRAELLRLCKAKDAEQLAEQAAYTWFNRFLAIRFMELHDYLPCGLRFFSSAGGAFDPQVLKEALRVEIEGLDRNQVLTAIREGDEPLFRTLFIAQCNELADCMPAVFGHVGSAMELLLPDNLLRDGGVLSHMVLDIPESDWLEGVEIVGWMYQYYVSERKDEVFASFKKGKKAERDAIAPATQLFTPHWIVRYLTENSLGRLWMLNHPDSHLVDKMEYYIAPDADGHEDVLPIASPEEITVCDPACGSGHILVYAFDVLAAIYEECGYMRRDIPRLILQKNLVGMEIDPRAAAMASFALTMKAMEWDSRFLSRGVSPDITVLQPVTLEAEELEKYSELAKQQHLLEIAAHMDECGSLFVPESSDIVTLESIKNDIENDVDIFTSNTADKIQSIIDLFKSLARTFTVVVANPPYMGSSNMDKWTADFTKKNYPDSKRDLCTCFIERCKSMCRQNGYSATVTSCTWMFISSFETLRSKILSDDTLVSMLHTQGPNNHPDVFDANAAMVLVNPHYNGIKGTYFRLDKLGMSAKESMLKEAIANPDCGWFYRADADTFKDIPGTPIAYWAVCSALESFKADKNIAKFGKPFFGITTGNNDRFIRHWFEISSSSIKNNSQSDNSNPTFQRWALCNRGGNYRKWFGVCGEVVDWLQEGKYMSANGAPGYSKGNPEGYFSSGVTWGRISSSVLSARFLPRGYITEHAGGLFSFSSKSTELAILALLNSSTGKYFLNILAPTLNYTEGPIGSIPVRTESFSIPEIIKLTEQCVDISISDSRNAENSMSYTGSALL